MPDPDDVSAAAERSAYAAPDAAPAGTEPSAGMAPAPEVPPEAEPTPSSGSSGPARPGLLERLPWWTVPLILIGVPLLFAALTKVVPGFYTDVVWHYYWGPIKADAMNCAQLSHLATDRCASSTAQGVLAHSGYNLVNTLSWAVLLGVCILGIAQMLAVFRTPMDDKLIVAATAWVVVGSVAHVLEDVGLFSGTLQYFFITPPIYLLFGAFGIASFLVAQWMRSIAARSDLHSALRVLWLFHIAGVLLWLVLWSIDWPQITIYVNPVWVALFAAINYFVARFVILRQGRVDASLMTLVFSLGTYLLVGAYVLTYITDPWTEPNSDGMPTAFLIAPALAAAVAGLVYLMARKAPRVLLGVLLVGGSLLAGVAAVTLVNVLLAQRLGLFGGLHGLAALGAALAVAIGFGARWWNTLRKQMPALVPLVATAYALAINLLLVFSQMLDGFATALGIDLLGYVEKHVLSARVIDVFRDFSSDLGWAFGATYPTFLAFAPVKLLVSLLVIYAIDVHSRDDARAHPTMIGLVKFAIIMVGIGPGVRDFTRMSLGV
ncbi:MAG: hypothetical protein QOC71_1828 [Thermoplasmata archaeon]|jgi:uncharacterized membrane protein|nr:hypothetical protein [Thermoplasmata archaeon]